MSSRVNEAEQAEAVKGRTLQEVEAELSEAAAGLQTLKAERDTLAERIDVAKKALDLWLVPELEARSRPLRSEIEAARARLWLLQAERARLLLPEAEEAAEVAREAYERAYASYLEAHARTNRLGVECDNAKVRAQGLRWTMEENERKAQAFARRTLAGQA